MATINASQDYDFISTLTFASASGTCNIKLFRGSPTGGTYAGTVYYRTGTSGSWTTLSVSGSSTTFPVGSTTMQVASDWNKSGDDHVTQSFQGQSSNLTEIVISQKATVSGNVGPTFMYVFAEGCSSLTLLDVPDTSGITGCNSRFFMQFARGCSSLTSLEVPDTSLLTTSSTVFFFSSYAQNCLSLTSLAIPDTSGVSSAGFGFMGSYAGNCSSLERLELPAAGWFASNNIDWEVPSGRLNTVKGYVQNNTDKSDWQDLVVSGETLHTNYIRSTDDVIFGSGFNPAFAHRRLLL